MYRLRTRALGLRWMSVKWKRRMATAGLFAVLILVGLWLRAMPNAPVFPSTESLGDSDVAGVVFVDENENGTVDDNDRAVVGAEVRVGVVGKSRQSLPSSAVQTGRDGSFVVRVPEELASVDYFVEVSLPLDSDVAGESIETWRQVAPGQHNVAVAVHPPVPCQVPLIEARQNACGTLMLPDLQPIVDGAQGSPDQPMPIDSWHVDDVTLPGRRLLRFASLTVNIGDGPLHVVAADTPEGGRLPTTQRIWTSLFQWVDEPAGSFVYHPGHEHIHLDAFEQYRLLSLDGQVIAEGGKVSFCLRDSIRLPALPASGLVVRSPLDCGDQSQAINPGFGDYYGANLDDQWIDVTGIDAGTYVVEIVVDPDNRLVESDETNNRVTFEVALG